MLPLFVVTGAIMVVNPAAIVCSVSGYAAFVHGHGAEVVGNPAASECGVPGYAVVVSWS